MASCLAGSCPYSLDGGAQIRRVSPNTEVVGHATDFIEHPELVAERLVKYARLVGRENVIAGTDCGLGARVGHPTIVWAKFEALAEGARLATKQLWNR